MAGILGVKQGLLRTDDTSLNLGSGGILIVGQNSVGGSIYIIKNNAFQLVAGNDWLVNGTISGFTITIPSNPYGLRYYFIRTNQN